MLLPIGTFSKHKINYLQLIKIAIGSCIAILTADSLGLSYSASAGIITLLSIQNTKKDTLLITGKRFLSFGLSVILAFLVFHFAGYHAFSFGIFLLLFVGGCYLLKLEEGISMNAVLATHFLIEESMNLYWIGNEVSLLVIGAGIGIILNLYMPNNLEAIKQDQMMIEEDIRLIISKLSSSIFEPTIKDNLNKNFDSLESHLNKALSMAYDTMNNTLLSDTRYYFEYIQMRKNQSALIKRIHSLIVSIKTVPDQAYKISDFFNKIAASFHEHNNAFHLIKELQEIRKEFKSDPLPVTRDEFEDRAILYQILNEIESFLVLKKEFVLKLSEYEIKKYWNKIE